VHRRAPHTRVHKGKKVLVLLRDGTRLVDRFHAYTSTAIVLSEHGAVAKADLPTFKGVWSTAVNFAPLPSPDTKPGRYPQHHRRADDSPGHHGLGS
jgi:hypothetical protein